jgi:RimJ/RimL family protein N-acetyltransferase
MAEFIYLHERISLTPITQDDIPTLVRYLNDPVLYRNTLRIPAPYTEKDAIEWLNLVQALQEEHGTRPNWAIRNQEHGLIGSIGCFLHTGLEGHRDEIGYWLAEPFRGKGIMTTVVQGYCRWLFEHRPALVRLEAKVFSFNPASARLLEKAGFEREGFARKLSIKNGELIDVILMARFRTTQ